MNPSKFKPKTDKFYMSIIISTILLLAGGTALAAFEPIALLIMIPTDALTVYFLFSPFFGYAELRENTLFIKFGFFIKREIPYAKIRSVEKAQKFISESMLSLKCAVEHINIRYGVFDIVTVSVKDNAAFAAALNQIIKQGQPAG